MCNYLCNYLYHLSHNPSIMSLISLWGKYQSTYIIHLWVQLHVFFKHLPNALLIVTITGLFMSIIVFIISDNFYSLKNTCNLPLWHDLAFHVLLQNIFHSGSGSNTSRFSTATAEHQIFILKNLNLFHAWFVETIVVQLDGINWADKKLVFLLSSAPVCQ